MSHNWDKSFTIAFDPKTGRALKSSMTKRYLSQMETMFQKIDHNGAQAEEDPVIYEFCELGAPERKGDLSFGTTIIHQGKIGSEFYMTKGHYHCQINTAEVYYTLSGIGLMLMENTEGQQLTEPMNPGCVVYVPRGYAHRCINTGTEDLVAFFCFQADAGHDYATIETKGYRSCVVEKDGQVQLIPNPRWNDE